MQSARAPVFGIELQGILKTNVTNSTDYRDNCWHTLSASEFYPPVLINRGHWVLLLKLTSYVEGLGDLLGPANPVSYSLTVGDPERPCALGGSKLVEESPYSCRNSGEFMS